VRKPTRSREVGRGEKVLPGVWRLRLPLPWPGVPHCNAWALAAGRGIVLVDTGMHEPGSMLHLERALDQALARRAEIARQSGVPEAPLQRWIAQRRAQGSGQAGTLEIDRELTEGDTVSTDLGDWKVIETPGHAPSHICLYQAERRLLISGDHLLGRVSLYFDVGYTPDPVGEFLDSLGKVEQVDARLALSGHGRPFTDVPGHIAANRELVAQQLDAVRAALAAGPRTAYELAQEIYGELFTEATATWLLTMTRAYLTHLERLGEVESGDEDPRRWRIAA
jgi:glyoxylase-like metal-dependent hydrolase (beta-lactamase superfamily II)